MTRALLVRLSAMGDLVQSLGAIQALRAAQPTFELCLLTQSAAVPLLAGMPEIEVIGHDRRGCAGAIVRTVRALRRLDCAIALDLQGNWKSAAFAWASRAPQRIGAAARWRQEPASRCLLTRTIEVDGPAHPAVVAAALVRELAPTAVVGPPRLGATTAEVATVAEAVRAAGVDPERPFRVLVAGRPADPRSLRSPAFERELQNGPPPLVLLGPGEQDVVAPAGAKVLRQTAGQLRELVALGALLARVGGEAVGGDQGPIHVLAAAGARTVVLFGPQDPRRTAPPAARAVQHPQPPACMPCRRRRCDHADGPVCMQFTSTEGREVDRDGSASR